MAALHSAQALNNGGIEERSMSYSGHSGSGKYRGGPSPTTLGYHSNSSQTRLQARKASNADLPPRIESANMPGTPRRPAPARNPISISQSRRPSELADMVGKSNQNPPRTSIRHSSTVTAPYSANKSSPFFERRGTEVWKSGIQWHNAAPSGAVHSSDGDSYDVTVPALVPHSHAARAAQPSSATGIIASSPVSTSESDASKDMTRKGFSESIRQHRRPTELSISPPRSGSVRLDRLPPSKAATPLSYSTSSSNLVTRTQEANQPSRTLQSSAEAAEKILAPVKSPKSSGTSRIAKLRAAWSPKTKTINPPPLVPESPSGGTKKTPLPFGMVTPARLKQRVSVANIGSPTLMRFTTLNEHGELVNIENSTSGTLPLDRAIPLTSLQAAAKLAGSTSSLPSTAIRSSFPGQTKAEVSQSQKTEAGSSEDGNSRNTSFDQTRPDVAALRLQRHASVESLPLSNTFDNLRGSRSHSTVDLNLPGISRAPYTRLRALRERSMTQGEFTSSSRMDSSSSTTTSSNPLSIETRAARSGSLRQHRGGLHTVSETHDLERESPNPQISLARTISNLTSARLPSEAPMSQSQSRCGDGISPTDEGSRPGAGDEETSLPTMWSQASDMTGYTASSESGFPAPDALGLVLTGSRARESMVFQSGLPSADIGSDSSTAASHISQSTQTPERTPSTLATASIHSSPVFMKGDHTFGSTAPRSPVNRRKVHVRVATADLSHSPSLDQILPDVELNTLGTPMPDAELETEILQVEGKQQAGRVASPLGINLLGLSQMCYSPEGHSRSGITDTPLITSSRQPQTRRLSNAYAGSLAMSVESGIMSRTSSTSTHALVRPQRKYAFEKITSPEQHKLILEEEEWMCRGLDKEDTSAHVPGPSSRAPVHIDPCASDDSKEEEDCASIYEVSSVEGSQDEHDRRDQSGSRRDVSQDSEPGVSCSNSGWDSSPERGILGMYSGSLSGSALDHQDTTASSPQEEVCRMPAKRDTVESLLLRAADLLADRGAALPKSQPVQEFSSISMPSPPVSETMLEDPDFAVEVVPESLELTGPADPSTGLATYQLKWKVILRKSKAPQTTTEHTEFCKVVRGTSMVTSTAAVCATLPTLKTPQNRSIAFPPRSPIEESPKTLITVPDRFQSTDQSFSNPFVPGQALHSGTIDGSATAAPSWPAFHLRTASYPDIALSSGKGSPDKSADLSGPTQVAASPQSPAFCPKPLLLVQSTELRSNRRRFDSNAESTSSPVSKTSSEFSRPVFSGRDGRSVTSSPALDPLNGRRRQISYIGSNNGHQNSGSSGRGSFERVRAVSGQRSPFLSSKSPAACYNNNNNHNNGTHHVSAEDSPASMTPRTYHGAGYHVEHIPSSSQVLGLSAASSRLAAVTGGRP